MNMRNSATHHYHSSKREGIRVRDFIVRKNKKPEKTAEFDLKFKSILDLSRHIAMFELPMLQKDNLLRVPIEKTK